MDAAKVAEITGHRFEGYTNGMLAIEVEQFQAGQGAGSIAEAVEALKAVATALADTDEGLRRGMDKLGIAWQGDAAEQAKSIFGGDADFAGAAKVKVNNSAQVAFVLSEAYSGMVNKLPDPEVLRAAEGGLTLGDLLGGLIGHETDHAAKVKAARAARDQAVDALTEFQKTCNDELHSVEPLDDPQHLLLDGSPATDDGPQAPDESIATSAAGSVDQLSRPDDSTRSAGAGSSSATISTGAVAGKNGADCPPEESEPRRMAAAAPVERTEASSTAPSVSTGSPAPIVGGIVPTPTPAPGPGSGGPGSGGPGPAPGGPGTGTPGAPVPPGGVVATPGAGSQSGGRPGGVAGAGSSSGGSGAAGAAAGKFGGGDSSRPGGARLGGFTGGFGGAPESADPLAKGKLTGATPPPLAGQPTAPPPVAPAAAAGGSLSGAAGGAAALAAAGVAGAASAEDDRDRRSRDYGKGQDVDGRPLHQIDVGEIPDEEAARNAERVEPEQADEQPKYLEQAAVQPGVSDATRVRTHGVDDVDLFADQRMAAPEVIGDDPATAYNANRKDTP